MTDHSVNRRQFARRLAVGTAAVGLSVDSPIEAEGMQPARVPADEADKKTPADSDKPPPPGLLLLEIVRQKYPDRHLEDEEILAGVYKELRGDLARGERLAKFPLKNSDEPATVFSAWRAEDD